jgi:hypothetical protein
VQTVIIKKNLSERLGGDASFFDLLKQGTVCQNEKCESYWKSILMEVLRLKRLVALIAGTKLCEIRRPLPTSPMMSEGN